MSTLEEKSSSSKVQSDVWEMHYESMMVNYSFTTSTTLYGVEVVKIHYQSTGSRTDTPAQISVLFIF